MAKLTVTSLSGEIPQGDISGVKEVKLQSRSLAEIESLEACKSLRRLDLKDNKLTSLACVAFNLELTPKATRACVGVLVCEHNHHVQ